ncbi:MAG: Ada metal-binding domain-containing protein [Thermodesulfobacteriota bacterium]
MKKIGIFITIIMLVAFLAVILSFAADYKYVGSAVSDKYYHRPFCKWVHKIRSDNRVTFKSAKEARAAGYIPCKVCRPPIKD